ncbi:MAG: synthase [Solimicrobium sp.]|nr:synthase [Solimicrobium sp.]
MTTPTIWKQYAHPTGLRGAVLEAPLRNIFIGEICELRASVDTPEVIARAQVVGFQAQNTILNVMGPSSGMSREMVIMPTGKNLHIHVGYSVLGCVLDSTGDVVERFGSGEQGEEISCTVNATPPTYADRGLIDAPLVTGIRAIDGMLTCGIGQRVGIFAPAGGGKTSLMHMLIEHGDADVFVIGLIGERGREVAELTAWLRTSAHRDRAVLVFATSDLSPVDRTNAAYVATTVAEFFRAQGKSVVLLIDSLTRFARALRDVALTAGEMPARRGYPASVFDALPKLLERSGKTRQGSITAFYTVLLESEDETDPIGDEVRSILDGHIYLSSKLAGQGHYPAINILTSASRVFSNITSERHQKIAAKVRQTLSTLEEMQIYIDLGEYKRGENQENDHAFSCKAKLNNFLRQNLAEASPFETTLKEMYAAIS